MLLYFKRRFSMSVSSIIDKATGKIYDDLIPQGGGVSLAKGQIITAIAGGTEVAFPIDPPADGSILSYDSNELTGLKYIAVPGATPLDYQELYSANAGNNVVVVPAPAHNGYVLTADTDPANATGLAWKAVGGSGTLTATAPLIDEEVANVSTISINYTAVKGEIPAGSGVAKTGVLVPAPPQDKYVLTSASAEASGLKWLPPTGATGIIDANAPLVDDAGVGTNTISINFGASVGEIPYGNGTAKIGALTNVPTAGQILGINAGVPAWINAGGSGTIVGIAPIVEVAGGGNESQIGIGFGASVGQLPYGNGTLNTGALTNTPTAGQILGIAGGVPAWVNAGGSGTITGTFPIVETAGGTNESVISIGFANKGDLVAGSGTANTGVILPPATADDYVLSSFSSAPSGMRWVAPTITQKIIRSATATTAVPDPQTTQDTLILVAEDPTGSWDLQQDPTDPGLPIQPYAIEMESVGQVVIDTVSCSCIAVPEIVNAIRCIRIYILTNTEQIPVGILYRSSYASPSLVSGIENPIGPPAVAYINNCFIVYGSFEAFHYDGATPPADVDVNGIALIDCSQLSADIITVKPLIDVAGQIGNSITGVVLSTTNNAAVCWKIINSSNYLWIFGNFDGFANGQNAPVLGYWSIAKWNLTSGGYDTAGTTVGLEGLAVSFDANIAPGTIQDAYLGYANNLYIVGAFAYVASIGTPLTWNAVPAGMNGFARCVFSIGTGNPWSATPTIAGGFQEGFCIRPSLSQPNNLIIVGFAPVVPIFLDLTANTLTASTGPIPASPQQGWLNSIVSDANIDIGFGAGTYDFVQFQDRNSNDMYVVWFQNASGLVAQPLLPSPTGLKPYYVPNTFPPSYLGPYNGFCSIGMYVLQVPTPNINIMATGGIYRFDPAIHAQLDFTGNFYYNGVAKTTARFSTATQGNESQSFVSSTSLKAWIQTGAKTTSLTYLP